MTDQPKNNNNQKEPTVAPGLDETDELEAKATDQEIAEGNYTLVTKLFLDRTPED